MKQTVLISVFFRRRSTDLEFGWKVNTLRPRQNGLHFADDTGGREAASVHPDPEESNVAMGDGGVWA